jgi:hypothetical protein
MQHARPTAASREQEHSDSDQSSSDSPTNADAGHSTKFSPTVRQEAFVDWRLDPAAAAHAEMEAFEALWRVVYRSALEWDAKLRYINTLLFVIASLNLFVIFTLFQGCWSPQTLRFSLEKGCSKYHNSQIASFILFFAFLGTLVWYYYEKSGYKAFTSHFPSRWSAFTHSGLKNGFIWEVCAALIQPFPLLYLFLDLSEAQYLVILSLLARFYLLLRLLRDWSEVYRKRLFIKQRTRFDTSFYAMDYTTIIKTYVYHETFKVLVIGCFMIALLLAYLMHLCEREYWLPSTSNTGLLPIRYRDMHPEHIADHIHGTDGESNGGTNNDLVMQYKGDLYYQSPYVSMINSLYFVGIVATTTGLGDIVPVTAQGKLFAVCCALSGIAIQSFVVAVFTNKLVPSNFQAYVIDYLRRSEIDHEKQKYAAIMIQRSWRLRQKYQRLAARGVDISDEEKRIEWTERLTPIMRKFQSIQRKEANQQFMFNEHSLTQVDVTQQREKHMLGGASDGPNYAAARAPAASPPPPAPTESLLQRMKPTSTSLNSAEAVDDPIQSALGMMLPHGSASSSSDASPLLTRSRPASYGSSEQPAARSLLSYPRTPQFPSKARDAVRIKVHRSNSESGKSYDAARASALSQRKPEMSAKSALKALNYLQKQPSAASAAAQSGASGPGLGRMKSVPSGAGSNVPSIGFRGNQGAAFDSSASIQSLVAAQANMSAYLQSLESKLDQLLFRASGENLVTSGHVFLRWEFTAAGDDRSPDSSLPPGHAVSKPVFVWHESDSANKYGCLWFTQESFAVQNRLKIKHAGQRVPLHLVSDVFLGKSLPEFQTDETAGVPSSQCFSLVTEQVSLHLQAQYKEERDTWVRQLKHIFSRAASHTVPASALVRPARSVGGTPLVRGFFSPPTASELARQPPMEEVHLPPATLKRGVSK